MMLFKGEISRGVKTPSTQRNRSCRLHLLTFVVLLKDRFITIWCHCSQMLNLTATCLASTHGDYKINSEESIKTHYLENPPQVQPVFLS